MAGKLTIINAATIKRKLKNGLIWSLILGSLYGVNLGMHKTVDWYNLHKKYKALHLMIEEGHYGKTHSLFTEIKNKLDKEEVSELEQKIDQINPNILLEKAEELKGVEKYEMLIKVDNGFDSLGEPNLEVKHHIIGGMLENGTTLLSEEDPNPESVNKTLDELLNYYNKQLSSKRFKHNDFVNFVLEPSFTTCSQLIHKFICAGIDYMEKQLEKKQDTDKTIQNIKNLIYKSAEIFRALNADEESVRQNLGWLIHDYGQAVAFHHSGSIEDELKCLGLLRNILKKYELKFDSLHLWRYLRANKKFKSLADRKRCLDYALVYVNEIEKNEQKEYKERIADRYIEAVTTPLFLNDVKENYSALTIAKGLYYEIGYTNKDEKLQKLNKLMEEVLSGLKGGNIQSED